MWLLIAEVSEQAGIPENSARRYTDNFSDFFNKKKVGRMTKYSPDAVGTIKRIAELYKRGLQTPEIQEVLQREFPQQVEVEDEDNLLPTSPPYAVMEEFRRTNALMLETMQRVSSALEKVTDQQQQMEHLMLMVEESRQREQKLEDRLNDLDEEYQLNIHQIADTYKKMENSLNQSKQRERQLEERLNELANYYGKNIENINNAFMHVNQAIQQVSSAQENNRPWWKFWQKKQIT